MRDHETTMRISRSNKLAPVGRFGKELDQICVARGLTDLKIEQLGVVDRSNLSRARRGMQRWLPDTIARFSLSLGLSSAEEARLVFAAYLDAKERVQNGSNGIE